MVKGARGDSFLLRKHTYCACSPLIGETESSFTTTRQCVVNVNEFQVYINIEDRTPLLDPPQARFSLPRNLLCLAFSGGTICSI